MTRVKSGIRVLIGVSLAAMGLLVTAPAANAAVVDAAPLQAMCDSGGSTTYLWGVGSLTGITRPVVASMTVNGETVPFGQIAAPNDHKLGVSICSNMSDARKVGFNVIHREGSSYFSDLAGGESPSGAIVDENTEISFTITNMGSQAEFYSFSLVHGAVSSWTTASLGTSSASLSVTMKPVRTPLVDFSAPGASLCSATPPVCDAQSSGLDILSASLDMDFDQAGSFEAFTGAYFGLEGAVSGFVQPAQDSNGNKSISATLGGPHTLDDGTTTNVGSMQAFLPTDVITDLFGLDAAAIDTSDLAVTRTDAGDPGAATFSVTPVAGGAVVEVTNITFSTPVFTIQTAEAAAASSGGAYRFFAADGGVFNFGANGFYGSAGGINLFRPVVGGASTSNDNGYWMVVSDGGVFAYGNASFAGSAASLPLNRPIVGMAATSSDSGYWLVGSDGGVFAYGDAAFYGSTGGQKLNAPIVAIIPTPTGHGYWLVASDGGVFAYGDAGFHGSKGGQKISAPVVSAAATPSGAGYWLVASDGGVFTFGDAAFHGSKGGSKLNAAVVGLLPTSNGGGYVLASADGGAFAYGNAGFGGSLVGHKLRKPVVAIG